MVLIEDTRQQKNKHLNVHRYCQEHNIKIVPMCLNVGDYMLTNGNVAIDTKANIDELANDLFRDKKAFNKKYKKCYKDNIKLIVLVEEKIKTKKDLLAWKSQHSKINGRFLLEMINDLKISYGIDFYFCNKIETGEYLIRLLNGENMK